MNPETRQAIIELLLGYREPMACPVLKASFSGGWQACFSTDA
jgi:hypothetical protein